MSSSALKLGIYFSHYECFGHTSRVMAVGEVFKDRFPRGDLFFIQAGVAQRKARIDGLGRVLTLPGTLMDRHHFRAPSHQAAVNTDERGKICESIINRERPGLLMSEFFPLGLEQCRYELIPALLKASAQGAAIWGIAGYPVLSSMDDGWRKKILKLYERIIIFSPAVEKEHMADSFSDRGEKERYLDFFEEYQEKITFAGYLLPQQDVVRDDQDENLPKPPLLQGACRVAVLRGGGAVYPKLIADAILASDQLGKGYHFTVVAGPSTTLQEWYLFATLVGKKKVNNVLLLRAVGDYEGLIAKSDVCVSMTGYHSSVMLLKHRKKAVLIPFEGYGAQSFFEQRARATMVHDMIGSKVLLIGDLSADNLASMISDAAAASAVGSSLPEGAFTGREVLDRALSGLFGQEP